MKHLQIRLLGNPAVLGRDGETLKAALSQQKFLALLAYCCVEGRHRYLDVEALGELLWPASADARSALNQTVHIGRKLLGADVWERSSTGALRVRPDAVACDVAYLLHGDPDAAWVATHCAGEVLPGLRIADVPAFEDWLDRQRSAVRRRAAEVLVAGAHTADGDLALDYVRRALELDPCHEAAALRMVKLLGARGARADAWRFFEEFRSRLDTDLDLAPSAELTRAVRRACASDTPLAPTHLPVEATRAIPETDRSTFTVAERPPAESPPVSLVARQRNRVAVAALGAFVVLLVVLAVRVMPMGRAVADTPPAWAADLVIAGGSSDAGAAWDAAVATPLAARLAEGGMRIARVIGRNDAPGAAPFRLRGSLTDTGGNAGATVALEDIRSGVLLGSWHLDASTGSDGLARLADSIRTVLRHAYGAEAIRGESRRAHAVDALIEARRELDEGRMAAFYGGARDVGALRLLRADSLAGVAAGIEPRWAQPHLLRAQVLELRAIHARAHGDLPATHERLGDAVAAAGAAIALGAVDEGRELRGALYHMQWVMNAPGAATARDAALRDLQAAVRYGLGEARTWATLSALYNATGRHADAYVAAQEALKRDAFGRRRDDIIMRLHLAALNDGRHTDARRWCDEMRLRLPGREPTAECSLALLLISETVTAHEILAHEIDLRREPPQRREGARVYLEVRRAAVLAAHGHRADARAAIARYEPLVAAGSEEMAALAAAYAHLGDAERARTVFDVFLQHGGPARTAALHSIWLRPLRPDPDLPATVP